MQTLLAGEEGGALGGGGAASMARPPCHRAPPPVATAPGHGPPAALKASHVLAGKPRSPADGGGCGSASRRKGGVGSGMGRMRPWPRATAAGGGGEGGRQQPAGVRTRLRTTPHAATRAGSVLPRPGPWGLLRRQQAANSNKTTPVRSTERKKEYALGRGLRKPAGLGGPQRGPCPTSYHRRTNHRRGPGPPAGG